MKEESSASQ
jgi:hypothetical protein